MGYGKHGHEAALLVIRPLAAVGRLMVAGAFSLAGVNGTVTPGDPGPFIK